MKGSSQLNVIAEDGLFRTINASLQVTDLVTSLTPSSPNSASSEQPSGPQIRVRKLNAGVSRFTVELGKSFYSHCVTQKTSYIRLDS